MSPRRVLFAERGTEVRISPLLEGIRRCGEKVQWYLGVQAVRVRKFTVAYCMQC